MGVRGNFIFCENIDVCLEKLRYDEYLAVAVSRLHAQNSPTISRTEMFCFTRANNVYSYSVAVPLSMDFQLIDAINAVIRSAMESGLINRWSKFNIEPATRSLATDGKPLENENATIVLTVDHIVGALLIMVFGYVLAIIVFLAERVVYWRVRQGTESKLFLYLHRFFCPSRIDCTTSRLFAGNLQLQANTAYVHHDESGE